MTRIALTDRNLLQGLRALKVPADLVASAPGELDALIGKVDFFLLDDETAIRFLGAHSEDAWPSVVVTAREGDPLPASYQQGLADDLLVLPPRALDLERVLRAHDTMKVLHGLEESSHNVGELVRQLQEDISLAQKIQRRLIREKFAPLGPLSVKSKYWCGLKAGGDYFDVLDLPGGTHAGLLLAGCTSYSLSTALIGSLVHFSVPVTRDNLDSPGKVAAAIAEKVRDGMKEKDRLSLLYAILDRKSYLLRYADCGGVFLAKRGRDGKVTWATRGERAPLTAAEMVEPPTKEFPLEPGDRVMLCSSGWAASLGESVPSVMEDFLGREGDTQDLLNDLAFRLRRSLEKASDEPVTAADDFPMPPEDCSVMVFELAQNTLRLAR